MSYKVYYRRNLPHFQPEGGILFVTFHEKIPMDHEIKNLIRNKRILIDKMNKTTSNKERVKLSKKLYNEYLDEFDNFLASFKNYEVKLTDSFNSKIIINSLHFNDSLWYKLYTYCIMPNHVHMIIEPLKSENEKYYPIAKIMKSIKGYSARKINEVNGLKGQFWHHESFDHCIRNTNEFEYIIYYILNNPVKAGLCTDYHEWKYSWVCEEIREQFY